MIAQGTPQWFAARLGRVTASRVADVVGRTRTGWGAARAGYMNQLLAERLTGIMGDGRVSPAMQWGIDNEGRARLAYQFRYDADGLLDRQYGLRSVGIDRWKQLGAPDFAVGVAP